MKKNRCVIVFLSILALAKGKLKLFFRKIKSILHLATLIVINETLR